MSTKEVTKKKGKVVQRNYVMKDVGALRKSWGTKLKHLQKNEDIGDVENDEAAKAATDSAGDAYVEYSMDITFMANQMSHTIKFIAYTTTCQIMIQPKGEPSGLKAHFGSRGTPRFFAETFLVPWCEQAIESKTFDVKLSNFYVNSIREDIKRLDVNKLEMKKLSKSTNAAESSEAKCFSKGCSFQGLNPNNKSAVGVCAKCGSFEHFACVKIKAEHKEDILKGTISITAQLAFPRIPLFAQMKT